MLCYGLLPKETCAVLPTPKPVIEVNTIDRHLHTLKAYFDSKVCGAARWNDADV
jgi:hypothetical protein